MINKAAILAGAVGGLAPNFLRLIVHYTSTSPEPIKIAPYCVALAGLAVLGGVVVWIFQETDLKRAFYVGIGLPSLLQVVNLQSQLSPNSHDVAPPPPGTNASISLISSAYAQTPPPTGGSAIGRKLNLTGATSAPQATVLFYGEDNKWVATKPMGQGVEVPQAAAKFAIQVGQSIVRNSCNTQRGNKCTG